MFPGIRKFRNFTVIDLPCQSHPHELLHLTKLSQSLRNLYDMPISEELFHTGKYNHGSHQSITNIAFFEGLRMHWSRSKENHNFHNTYSRFTFIMQKLHFYYAKGKVIL